MKKKLLSGIIVPTITPLTSDGALDVGGLEMLIEHLLCAGVTGLLITGTTGEGPALSYDLRREVIKRVCRLVGNSVPVVVAAIETALAETMKMIGFAADSGAAAVAIVPPFYLAVSQSDIYRFGCAVASHSRLPVYLYNVPNANLPRFSLTTLRELAQLPTIRGLKDSSGDLGFLKEAIIIFADRPETSVLFGPEKLLVEGLRAGADGGVNGGANLFPQLYMTLYRACQANRWQEAEQLHSVVLRVSELFYHFGENESSLVRGVKGAASLMGICGKTLAPPYQSATAQDTETIAERLHKFTDEVKMALRDSRSA